MDTNKKHEQLTKYTMTLVQCKARQLVGKAGYTHDDLADIEQDLIKSLLACMPQFDPAKATLNTFADRVVGSRIVDLLRRRNAEIRNRGREAFSLNEEIETEDGTVGIIETVSQDEIDLRTGRYNRPPRTRHLRSTECGRRRSVARVAAGRRHVADGVRCRGCPRVGHPAPHLPRKTPGATAQGFRGTPHGRLPALNALSASLPLRRVNN